MGFYDFFKEERDAIYIKIQNDILNDLITNKNNKNTVTADDNNSNNSNNNSCIINNNFKNIIKYFSNNDTYIRKAGYLAVGKIYKDICNSKCDNGFTKVDIINVLEYVFNNDNEKVRQTVINSCGEIAVSEFEPVEHLFEIGLNDSHHSVRNAIQGSLKKAGAKNHKEIIRFCKKHIKNQNPEIRRQVAHGLELRGRTHPEDIMFALKELQFDNHKRVRPMVIHIFSQISYREGCLEKVTKELLTWEDTGLVEDCFSEIIKHHKLIEVKGKFKTVKTLSAIECKSYINDMKNKDI